MHPLAAATSSPASLPAPAPTPVLPPLLLGALLGTALQVQQPVLWAAGVYIGVTVFAFALTLLARRARPGAARALGWLLAAALAAFGTTGWRATMMLAERLTPALEGRDVLLTGTVSRMPQKSEAGWRFRFDVQQAQLDGAPVPVPPPRPAVTKTMSAPLSAFCRSS